MGISYEGPTKPTRHRLSDYERIYRAVLRHLRLIFDARARRRSEGSKRAWQTRKSRSMAVKVAEPKIQATEFDKLLTPDDIEHSGLGRINT